MVSTVTTERNLLEVEAGGAALKAFGALSAATLSVLGLFGIVPAYMASIAAIVVGTSLLAEGAAIGREYTQLLGRVGGGIFGVVELGTGMTAEFVIGGGAITLGVLSLMGVHALVLLAAAVIAIGAALILTSGSATRLTALKLQAAQTETEEIAQSVSHAIMSGTAGAQALTGVAAVVLGILAFSVHPLTLILVGLLAASGALALSGSALGGKMFQEIRRLGSPRRPPTTD
jgi:hypothetical protein